MSFEASFTCEAWCDGCGTSDILARCYNRAFRSQSAFRSTPRDRKRHKKRLRCQQKFKTFFELMELKAFLIAVLGGLRLVYVASSKLPFIIYVYIISVPS